MNPDANLSLDEIIRRNRLADGIPMLTMRKKKKEDINKEDLDRSLDEIIHEAENSFSISSQPIQIKDEVKSEDEFTDLELDRYVDHAGIKNFSRESSVDTLCGRFNRKSMKDSDADTDDEDDGGTINGGDIDMKPVNDLGIKRRFTTIEAAKGIRIPSQQWRVEPSNVLSRRPEGMKRLEFVSNWANRLHRVDHGRVNRNRTRFTGNFNKNLNYESIVQGAEVHGEFVEKQGFTYKFGDRSDGTTGRLIGVERKNTFVRPRPRFPERRAQSVENVPPISVNINYNLGQSTSSDNIGPSSSINSSEIANMLKMITRNIESRARN